MSLPLSYYLDEMGEPVGVPFGDPKLYAWWEVRDEPGPRNRRVASDTVGHLWVSTVFLSIDHQFGMGPPVLWETMIFNNRTGESDLYCERYTSREEAERRHVEIVGLLREGKSPDELQPS
jgi:hypothetical protein